MEPQPPANTSHASSPQDFWLKPQHNGNDGGEYVVYMLPGNPCIMTYYHPFLSKLFSCLNDALALRRLSAQVGGYTLPGFGMESCSLDDVSLPASLQDQIGYAEKLIRRALKKHVEADDHGEHKQRPKVILVAHSAGTYMALEILRRYTEGHNALSDVTIVGTVLICPAITDAAESRNGSVANVS
jgi:pimeloyl-ACP methyl ester carboxylesterase